MQSTRLMVLILTVLSLAAVTFQSARSYESPPEAASSILLGDTTNVFQVAGQSWVLEDKDNALSISDVLSGAASGRFSPATQKVPSFGFSQSAFWAKWIVTVPSGSAGLWMLELAYPPTQWIDVYSQPPDGTIEHQRGGSMVLFTERPFAHHTHVFPLKLQEGSTTLLVRISGEASKSFPLRMMHYDVFAVEGNAQVLVLGAYFGCIAALLLYNLFIYVTVRETAYLFYILFLLSYILIAMNLTGLSQGSLWRNHPDLATRTIPITIGLLGIFATLFTIKFLDTARIFKSANKVLRGGLIWSVTVLTLPFLASYHLSIIYSTVFTSIFCIVILTTAVIAVKKGNQPARYYLIAWLMLLVGMASYALAAMGLLPENPVSRYGFLWGSAIEAILLSVALAARLRSLREENERARQKIAEQDKMANLGLLSAGVAHEINNPNHFLSLSASTAESRIRELKTFIDELIDDGASEDIRKSFDRRFTGIFEQLSLVREGSQRISTIVKSMRAASRDDSKVETQTFDPVDTLHSTVELVRANWKNKIQFVNAALAGCGSILGHPSRLSQVYTNLLVNACHAIEEQQASKADSRTGTITVESARSGQYIDIVIRDNGCGMTDEVLQRLFEPFFTTKDSDRGTGLGMGICRTIISEHHGRLTIDSTPGIGTNMTLSFPVSEPT